MKENIRSVNSTKTANSQKTVNHVNDFFSSFEDTDYAFFVRQVEKIKKLMSTSSTVKHNIDAVDKWMTEEANYLIRKGKIRKTSKDVLLSNSASQLLTLGYLKFTVDFNRLDSSKRQLASSNFEREIKKPISKLLGIVEPDFFNLALRRHASDYRTNREYAVKFSQVKNSVTYIERIIDENLGSSSSRVRDHRKGASTTKRILTDRARKVILATIIIILVAGVVGSKQPDSIG